MFLLLWRAAACGGHPGWSYKNTACDLSSGGEGVSEEENSGDEEDLLLLAKDGPADLENDGKGKRLKKSKKDKNAPLSR